MTDYILAIIAITFLGQFVFFLSLYARIYARDKLREEQFLNLLEWHGHMIRYLRKQGFRGDE